MGTAEGTSAVVPQAERAVEPLIDEEQILQRKTHVFRLAFGKSWVECKEKLTIGDRSAINESTVSGKIISRSGEEVELGHLSLGNSVIQTLIQAITNWGGPAFCKEDHEGKPPPPAHRCDPLPLTPEYIAIINDTPAQKILGEVNRRNPTPQKGPGSNPTNGSERKS